ncbi:MAG TPA: phosphatidate cytidylyltransferase [Ktedonobacterales bacterium]
MAVSTSTGPRSSWLVGLRRRVASALVLIPVVIALAWFGGWIAFAGVVLVLLLGTWELRDMFAHRGWHPLVVLSLALSLVFFVAAMLPAYRVLLLEAGISALVIGSFAWLMITRPTIERTLVDWSLTLAIPFYLGWPLAFLLLLRGDTLGYESRGFWWLWVLLLAIWANDTFALLVGHYLGRHLLAPHISPKKTWEGFVGGMVFAVIAVFVVITLANVVLNPALRLNVPWYSEILIGVLIVMAGTIGDLAESMLKRGTGVKDSGSILPGHGGILDRIDSILFAVFVVFFYALALGQLH